MEARRSYRPLAVVVTAALVYVLAVIQRMSPPVVALEIMNDLAMTADHMSLMFAVTMLGYGLMQPVAGFWADCFGPRKCLSCAALILGAASLIFSLSPGLGPGLAARALVGLAAGVALMPCLKLASHWFSPARFGLASSLIVSAAALANFAVGRPLASAASAFGWRGSFFGLGVMGLGLAVLVFLIVRDHPPQETAPETEPGCRPRPAFFQTARLIVGKLDFWRLALIYGATDLAYGAFIGLWAGPWLMEVHHLSEVEVGNILSVSAFGFLIGPPLLVILAQAWKSPSKVLAVVALANTLIALVLVRGPETMSYTALCLFCFIAPVGGQVAPLLFVLTKSIVPDHLGASAMGLINIAPILAGGLMQKVVGGVLTRAGGSGLTSYELYGQAFQPMLICLILSIPLTLWQVRAEKKSRGKAD